MLQQCTAAGARRTSRSLFNLTAEPPGTMKPTQLGTTLPFSWLGCLAVHCALERHTSPLRLTLSTTITMTLLLCVLALLPSLSARSAVHPAVRYRLPLLRRHQHIDDRSDLTSVDVRCAVPGLPAALPQPVTPGAHCLPSGKVSATWLDWQTFFCDPPVPHSATSTTCQTALQLQEEVTTHNLPLLCLPAGRCTPWLDGAPLLQSTSAW